MFSLATAIVEVVVMAALDATEVRNPFDPLYKPQMLDAPTASQRPSRLRDLARAAPRASPRPNSADHDHHRLMHHIGAPSGKRSSGMVARTQLPVQQAHHHLVSHSNPAGQQ
jgi:hypothetical protein